MLPKIIIHKTGLSLDSRLKESINLDTLFLDRDGVINKKLEGYVKKFEDFHFIEGVLESINIFSQIFTRIILVTNQQGIGKGIMTELDLHNIHEKMKKIIENNGGNISQIYFCPHLSSDNCICRKPKPGMFYQAIGDFPDIDISNSYMVGDSDHDILAANAIKLEAIKVSVNHTLSDWCDELLNKLKYL